jgi:hypothetical protein
VHLCMTKLSWFCVVIREFFYKNGTHIQWNPHLMSDVNDLKPIISVLYFLICEHTCMCARTFSLSLSLSYTHTHTHACAL